MEYVNLEDMLTTYATSAKTIIGGDIVTNSGYTGSNVKVGVIDMQHPNLSTLGANATGITIVNGGATGSHGTRVCAIIKKMVPSAKIYTYAATSVPEVVEAIELLIQNYGVSVINISCGLLSDTGEYNQYSRAINELIYREKCTICIAAGNPETDTQTIYNKYVNCIGLAPNAITVGAVTRTGTDPAATNAYQIASYSMYRQASGVINKPDICAPGNVTLYGENVQGTSYATPLITGTVAQMMAVKSALAYKPETVKSILLASASYNGGTSMGYIENSIGSDREGAGVVDAEFCYYSTAGTMYNEISITSTGYTTINAYCSYTNRPFRIAATWDVNSSESANTTHVMDLEMQVYKNGVLIATSAAYVDSEEYGNVAYEIISIDTSILRRYGSGYYQVKIGSSSGTFNGPNPNRIGVSWGQVTY